jgi:hypothetical protein
VTLVTRFGHFNAAVTRAACCVLRRLSAHASKLPIKSGRSIVATALIARGCGNKTARGQGRAHFCVASID